jgi:hypothetical protein
MEMFYKTLTMNDFHCRRLDVRSIINNLATDVAQEYDDFVFKHILELTKKRGIIINESVFSIWLAKLRSSGYDLICEYNADIDSHDYFRKIQIKLVQVVDSVNLSWINEFVFDCGHQSCKSCANKDRIDPETYNSFCQECCMSDADKNPTSCKYKPIMD